MQIEETRLPGVLILTPRRFGDARGHFAETWNRRALAEAGLELNFVQDNAAWSAEPGTVRGLHMQGPPEPQDKLVRVTRGRIMDVAVDARTGAPTYGQWVAVELSAEAGNQLLVPAGFLHGYATLEPDCDVTYKCTGYYAPQAECAVRFDDPDLGIDWGIDPADAVLSDKDAAAGSFRDLASPFTHDGR